MEQWSCSKHKRPRRTEVLLRRGMTETSEFRKILGKNAL